MVSHLNMNVDKEKMSQKKVDQQVIKNIISTRRSTFPKHFTGESIPDETITELLDLAHMAPNHKKTMPWRYFVFTKQSLSALLDFKKEIYIKNTPEDKVKKGKIQAFEDRKEQVSHIIGIAVHNNESLNLLSWEELAAVSCSVQNIYLSLNSYGIGGYWSTGNVTGSQEIRGYLDLAENEEFMGFLYLGVPDSKTTVVNREPIAGRVKWMND
jgi:nitroreductase